MKRKPLNLVPLQAPDCSRCKSQLLAHFYRRRGVEYVATTCPRCGAHWPGLASECVTVAQALEASRVLKALGRQLST